MAVFNARQSNKEQIILLFSVNGTSQYCALAEVAGPWDQTHQLDGWYEKTAGSGTHG
jgi:hypothetical protein